MSDGKIPARSPSEHTIKGVDSLRFFAAAWVVLYHGGQFPIEHLVSDPRKTTLLHDLGRLPFNGVSAVVLFFVISGFVIHFGSTSRAVFDWRRFLIQRVIRIGAPLVGILLFSALLGPTYSAAVHAVLWSVYSEIIYYLLYPLMRHMMVGRRMASLLGLSAAVSLAMAIANPHLIFPGDFGPYTWLFCLPMWLVGCLLAQLFRARRFSLPRVPLWALRLAAILFGAGAAVLSHLPGHAIGYIWTMPPFSIYCALWLWIEVNQFRLTRVTGVFEALGAAGYSIYLTHKIVINAAAQISGHLNWLVLWSVQLLGFIVLASAFYFAVERPSHTLSRALGASWAKRRSAKLQGAE